MIINGDAGRVPLGDKLVHCVVTSPPYWSLRKYAGEQERDWGEVRYSPMPGLPQLVIEPMRCALGLEKTVEAFISHLVLVFREVGRVLRDDGVCWVVIGDSYASAPQVDNFADQKAPRRTPDNRCRTSNIDAGNLLMVPHRLALALQADGWIVRNDCPWNKVNPMPESVRGWTWTRCRVKVKASRTCKEPAKAALGNGRRDVPHIETDYVYTDCPGCDKCADTDGYVLRRGSWRHTRAHETVLMLIKNMQYWSDQEKVREAVSQGFIDRWGTSSPPRKNASPQGLKVDSVSGESCMGANPSGRNPRSVLTVSSVIPAQQIGPSHFAFEHEVSGDTICKVSPDCPVHGGLLGQAPTQLYDEHKDASLSPHTEYTDAHLALLQFPDCVPTDQNSGHYSEEQNSDLPHRPCSQPAIDHSKKTCKTDHVPPTSSQDTSCAQTDNRIEHRSESPALSEPNHDNAENKTLIDDLGAHLLPNIPCDIADIPSELVYLAFPPPPSCACTFYHQTAIVSNGNPPNVFTLSGTSYAGAHYAVFSPKLIAPLIRATCPAKCCPVCETGWSPVVEPSAEYAKHLNKDWADYDKDDTEGRGHFPTDDGRSSTRPTKRNAPGLTADYNVLGYRPSCECNADYLYGASRQGRGWFDSVDIAALREVEKIEGCTIAPVPGIVLDPFIGSGTTGAVAKELGLRWIGLDLAHEYLDQQAKVRTQTGARSDALEGLPMFGGESGIGGGRGDEDRCTELSGECECRVRVGI